MFKYLTIIIFVGVIDASILFNLPKMVEETFNNFKNNFDRHYESEHEEHQRKLVFASNLDTILKHNKEAEMGLHSYRLGINNFSDLTNQEFRQMFLRLYTKKAFFPNVMFEVQPNLNINQTVDWTTKGVVTSVKDGRTCGASWAFSAVASIEGQHALNTGKLMALSVQNLIDCSQVNDNDACNSGTMDNAFKYVISNGIDTEASYPYRSIVAKCNFNPRYIGATISSYVDIPKDNENALKQAVATIGPISTFIDASQISFQLYQSGVYDEPLCSNSNFNHAVAIVGYGILNGKDYWKVKNSWSASWGEDGYILMSRNKGNQCCIATRASYPLV